MYEDLHFDEPRELALQKVAGGPEDAAQKNERRNCRKNRFDEKGGKPQKRHVEALTIAGTGSEA